MATFRCPNGKDVQRMGGHLPSEWGAGRVARRVSGQASFGGKNMLDSGNAIVHFARLYGPKKRSR
jgi:hypothetical protein